MFSEKHLDLRFWIAWVTLQKRMRPCGTFSIAKHEQHSKFDYHMLWSGDRTNVRCIEIWSSGGYVVAIMSGTCAEGICILDKWISLSFASRRWEGKCLPGSIKQTRKRDKFVSLAPQASSKYRCMNVNLQSTTKNNIYALQ